MSNKMLAISIIILLVLAVAACAYLASEPAPMTGHISDKTYMPTSYPVKPDTPWVYVLGITSTDGKRATSWYVDEDTYNRYSVGDKVTRGMF